MENKNIPQNNGAYNMPQLPPPTYGYTPQTDPTQQPYYTGQPATYQANNQNGPYITPYSAPQVYGTVTPRRRASHKKRILCCLLILIILAAIAGLVVAGAVYRFGHRERRCYYDSFGRYHCSWYST
ncbi:hypothetical protein BGZ60DRAFT_408057 [Tricladium varicosporioides]|nr:hypothetical protein BGZ60DRAFT_408057 [Hymenoscyphus varicosporioides]